MYVQTETFRKNYEPKIMDAVAENIVALVRSWHDAGASRSDVEFYATQVPVPPLFANRRKELASLDEHINLTGEDARRARCVLVHGQDGVGKRSLVREWASRNRGSFPAGQWYIDLAEYRTDSSILIGDALADILYGMGVSNDVMPSTVAGRSAMVRSHLSRGRSLLVIENVVEPAYLRVFLGLSATSAVLATASRFPHELYLDGVVSVPVGVLDAAHTREVFEKLQFAIGDSVPATDPDLSLTNGLPLAIALFAASGDPAVGEVPYDWGRLQGENRDAVALVLQIVLTRLQEQTRRAFLLLALLPPSVWFDVEALSEFLGQQAQPVLEALLSERVVETDPGHRQWRVPELLRIHARREATRLADEREAFARIVEHFVVRSQRLDRAISLSRLRLTRQRRIEAAAATRESPFSTWGRACVTIQSVAETKGLWEPVAALAEALWPALHQHRYHDLALEVFGRGVHAARALDDSSLTARLEAQRSRVLVALGRIDEALVGYAEASRLALGHDELLASIGEWRALAYLASGDVTSARRFLEDSLLMAQRLGSMRAVAIRLYHLGEVDVADGRDATPRFRAALSILDEESDSRLVGRVRLALAACLTEWMSKVRECERAIACARRAGDTRTEVEALVVAVAAEQGHQSTAEHASQARLLADELGWSTMLEKIDALVGA